MFIVRLPDMSSRRHSPPGVFKSAVQHFPLPSVNLIIRNPVGEFLFVKRLNEPLKGEWWVPGGRLMNGERVQDAVHNLLADEMGMKGTLICITPEWNEELFDATTFSPSDRERYGQEATCIHYIATAALIDVEKDASVTLDDQSGEWKWSKQLPNDHPYLRWYFEALTRTGENIFSRDR